MSAADADDVRVSQSLTDVLARMDGRIDQGFGRLESAIGDKASKHDLDRLVDTVNEHGHRIAALEGDGEVRKGVEFSRREFWSTVAGAVGVAAGIGYIVVSLVTH